MSKNNNFAFIDNTNLYKGVQTAGWEISYKKLRVYLKDKYGVSKAYLFLGYLPERQAFYTELQNYGYQLVFKPTLRVQGKIKGNCDAELVFAGDDRL